MASSNHYYKTLTDKELEKKEVKQLTLGIYSIDWGIDNSFDWVCKEQHEKKTILEHDELVIGVEKLVNQPNKNHFLSIDLDHTIHISRNDNGRLVRRLTGHTDRVVGVIELKNGDLLSVSLDNTIKYWDLQKYRCLATIEASISSLDDLNFANERTLITKEKSSTKLWELNGNLLFELTGFTKPIKYIREFKSGTWIVEPESESPSQWSSEGKLLNTFPFSFSARDDVFELNNFNLLIKNSQNAVQLWSEHGEFIETHVKDVAFSEHFKQLVASKKETVDWIDSHQSADDYPSTCNNLDLGRKSYVKNTRKEITAQESEINVSKVNRTVWDFFFRPVERRIKTALKTTIDTALNAEEALLLNKAQAEKEIERYRKKRKFAKFAAFFFFTLTLTVASIGTYSLVLTDNHNAVLDIISPVVDDLSNSKASLKGVGSFELQMLFGGISGVLCFIALLFFIRNRRKKGKQIRSTGNLALIEAVLSSCSELITEVKTYRTQILDNLPSHKDTTLFHGDKVKQLIDDKINNEIKQTAMRRCGIDESDITYQHGNSQKSEAIISQDWSVIQEGSHPELNEQNETAVRFDKYGQPVFAVRFIQFIFLTKEKVDVFYTYYDFITDVYIGRESTSIFFKHVGKVGVKDVQRQGLGYTLNGTQMTLENSGSQMSLTFMNDKSIKELSTNLTDDDVKSSGEEVDSAINQVEAIFESEINELSAYYQNEIVLAQDAKNEKLVKELETTQQRLLDYLDDQITVARNYDPAEANDTYQSKDQQVLSAINNIRAQINSHKQSEKSLS